MKLIIFGATGKTGIELVKQALEHEHEVTAFLRDPTRLPIEDERLTLFEGDVFDAARVATAIQNQDGVICALGSGTNLKKTEVRTIGTMNIIQGMQEHGVKRLLVVSAMGTGESWNRLSLINKFMYAVLMKNVREEHEEQEAAVKTSSLDWAIIRPSGLTDDPRSGVYDVGEDISAGTSKISRADVADLILKELEQGELIGKAVIITN